MPSSSIDNCAGVNATAPFGTLGQTNRPCSRRLANRHIPWPSHHSTLSRSPRRPRNANRCPLNGSAESCVYTRWASPSNPRRRSVTPAASHTRVPEGNPIIGADSTTPPVASRHRPRRKCESHTRKTRSRSDTRRTLQPAPGLASAVPRPPSLVPARPAAYCSSDSSNRCAGLATADAAT
jgi:hypothetical protein